MFTVACKLSSVMGMPVSCIKLYKISIRKNPARIVNSNLGFVNVRTCTCIDHNYRNHNTIKVLDSDVGHRDSVY